METQTKFGVLRLSSGFEYNGAVVPDDLEDSSTRPGLITRTIFSHMLPFEVRTFPAHYTFVQPDREH